MTIKLLKKVGVSSKPKQVRRLGEKGEDGSPRPTKVVFSDNQPVKIALSNAKKLRNTDPVGLPFNPAKVYICPDQTKLEREKDIELRKELKFKRDNEKNFVWKIS